MARGIEAEGLVRGNNRDAAIVAMLADELGRETPAGGIQRRQRLVEQPERPVREDEACETQAAALRAERLAAEKAGRRPAYCPPAKPVLTAQEVLAAFRTIPVARRPQIQVKDALRALNARKFPCRA